MSNLIKSYTLHYAMMKQLPHSQFSLEPRIEPIQGQMRVHLPWMSEHTQTFFISYLVFKLRGTSANKLKKVGFQSSSPFRIGTWANEL